MACSTSLASQWARCTCWACQSRSLKGNANKASMASRDQRGAEGALTSASVRRWTVIGAVTAVFMGGRAPAGAKGKVARFYGPPLFPG